MAFGRHTDQTIHGDLGGLHDSSKARGMGKKERTGRPCHASPRSL